MNGVGHDPALKLHGIHRRGTGGRGICDFCAGPVRLGRSPDQSAAEQHHIGIRVTMRAPKTSLPWGYLTDRQGKVQDVNFKGEEGLFTVVLCHIHGGSTQDCSG